MEWRIFYRRMNQHVDQHVRLCNQRHVSSFTAYMYPAYNKANEQEIFIYNKCLQN